MNDLILLSAFVYKCNEHEMKLICITSTVSYTIAINRVITRFIRFIKLNKTAENASLFSSGIDRVGYSTLMNDSNIIQSLIVQIEDMYSMSINDFCMRDVWYD